LAKSVTNSASNINIQTNLLLLHPTVCLYFQKYLHDLLQLHILRECSITLGAWKRWKYHENWSELCWHSRICKVHPAPWLAAIQALSPVEFYWR